MSRGWRVPPVPEHQARCRCGAKPTFGTDGDGHVVETCTVCGQTVMIERMPGGGNPPSASDGGGICPPRSARHPSPFRDEIRRKNSVP